MVRFDQSVCADLNAASKLEWLETNGLGGFASATVAGVHTRRYHGLLTAATKPPLGRLLLLASIQETLIVDGLRFDLSANIYEGAVHPQGYLALKEFKLDPFPVFTYQAGGVEIEKRVFMAHGENTTIVEYEFRSLDCDPAPDCTLELRPLIAFRDYHGATHANGSVNPTVLEENGIVSVEPYAGLPRLYLGHNAERIETAGYWYFNFHYPVEAERGLDSSEDLFCPLLASFDLGRPGCAVIVASTQPRPASAARELKSAEVARRMTIRESAPVDDPIVGALTSAADQFIVRRGDLSTIIAGYPWFGDWGRDTMIALPGLTLVTGRYAIARNILLEFSKHVNRGMLPNRFPDGGDMPEYNTVDATLWYFEAVRAYAAYTGDLSFVREHLYSKLKDIVDWHMRGTRYGIRMDNDGLLLAGEPGVQLTWMDSKIGDWVVTPRHGKPVEIQALWYNALRSLQAFAGAFGDRPSETILGEIAALARTSFNDLFWNEADECLYDVVNGPERDASIRPNQVIAASLHHTMLPVEQARKMLAVVERELLTPVGLRSLSPRDPRYRGHYIGDGAARDAIYHQGTVWPWLMGPFLTAYVNAQGQSAAAKRQAYEWLEGVCGHLSVAGLGQISEILDGDPPHEPRGCIAQAWSVAEILRAAVENVIENRQAAPLAQTA